ncbi:MAG: hypothetical protein H0T46_23240 [Deltaproteobacteria bacterium]|nr:hypothetical protein [Deltaproteobacteria bacterium]
MRGLCSLALLVACDIPQPAVICHNGNCVEPTDAQADDTIEALRASLALEYKGRPAFDGIELDSFWRAEDSTCLYAHDLDAARATPALEPAMELAAHFAEPGDITYSGGPFEISLELKTHVAVSHTARHTPEQRTQHAMCAWEMYAVIADGAVANNRDVVVVFSSFEGALLREIMATAPFSRPIPHQYAGILGVPAPLDPQSQELSTYEGVPLSAFEIHDQWIHDAQWEALLSMDVEIVFWMFSATAETFEAIQQYEPDKLVTSEARLMRRWLDR